MTQTVATTTPARVAGAPLDRQTKRRIIIASTVGTTIEFYDFYAYATAAVAVFPYLFFPKNQDPTVGLLASFATFGLAFVARPLGSVLFGHFGDRIGRKATLVGSLLTMGIATFLIGLLPTYAQAGVAAPAMLALMRFGQGLGLGGEWSGAALLATETAEKGKRAWAAMWPQLGAPFGFLAANGLFLVLVTILGHKNGETTGDFMTWGWRIPFLLSAVMVLVGLYVRFKLEETPVFAHAVDTGKKVSTPLTEVFKTSWKPLIIGTFVMVACYTLFYLVTTWILSYGIGKRENGGLGIAYIQFLKLQLISIFAFIAGIPLSGWLADKFGRRRILLVVSIIMIGFGFTFPIFLAPSTATTNTVLAFLTIGMFIMGLIFGPMSAVLPELYPTNVRYTGSGIAYNVSSILGAAIAPFVATWLVKHHGVGSVGIYLVTVTIISLLAILAMPETKDHDMTQI
ncbi:MFS transporter [Corynebacterium epidermidicanis]|uniref:Arabinose efflux permease family protein n=1 Tax=Corynebacterium epidermidicanis TaxID=1050174 RepID=A0A0G3GR86_9CORY|nr:MFS transporter [Corynebacterium epidermidicanis]AKK03105.1 arabinose efflux permease family protein [Corynebacterium epidermidicanis]